MQHKSNTSIQVVRAIVSAVALMFAITSAISARAQNHVPPTARQAAQSPEFAARLARHSRPYAPGKSWRPQSRRTSPLNTVILYENGPANGTSDAWTINFGFVVSDTFTIGGQGDATVSGLTFAAWLFPGDTLTSAEVSITSDEFGGTTYFDQTLNFTESACTGNQYGYNVCTETVTFSGPALASGTYWVNLQNASVPSGDPVYWDENSGVGCQSTGCPSTASETDLGTVPSEAFSILGTTTTTTTTYPPPIPCFEPGGNLQVIHDFTPEELGGDSSYPNGVTVDNSGNLYVTASGNGNSTFGVVYKMSEQGQDWLFNPLYSFTGGDNGFDPQGTIVGPEGALYGTSAGGIPTCSTQGSTTCGLVYRLRPPFSFCPAVLCSWNQTVLYRFTGDPDGWAPNGNLVFDQAGNLYGTTLYGGTFGQGTVYELTPANGGWTEKIIYSFDGRFGGAQPNSLLMGHDGYLYGLAGNVIFQLVPAGNHWTENVLYSFKNTQNDGSAPQNLVQDSSGNLYGISTWSYEYYESYRTAAVEFELERSHGEWSFHELILRQTDPIWFNDRFNDLAIDTLGNLYVSGVTLVYDYCDLYLHCEWYVLGLVDFVNEEFYAYGLAPDAQGRHLYGLTGDCGANGRGTVWQISRDAGLEPKAPRKHLASDVRSDDR